MESKLSQRPSHPHCHAENPIEITLREAFCSLEPKLRPPFPLTIPTQEQYLTLNKAILYGILCKPHLAKVHIKYLHAIINDGYHFFTSMLIKIIDELYGELVESVKRQLLWATHEMVYVSAVGFDGLLVALLRQIIGGDFGEENLWLCFEMVNLFSSKWDCLLDEEPLILTGALYVFLRLLADHCRVLNVPKINSLRKMENEFCIRMLREKFSLCLRIGRDLIRLLHDLVHVPEFRAIWKDLLCNPSAFKCDGFVDISQIYSTQTSRWYFSLRLTPKIESELRFLLTRVKFGSQACYQVWFNEKFLSVPDRKNALLVDIVRFISCAHHPPNDIIRSDIIPRWAVIGWLIMTNMKKYVEANLKLALFYDWLFFDGKVHNIMNIEPAILLMVHSVLKYSDITNSLLEFLFILSDNYDLERKEIVHCGIKTAFLTLVRKGVVQTLDVLTSCDRLSPILKERLVKLLSEEVQNTNMRHYLPLILSSGELEKSSQTCFAANLETRMMEPETKLQSLKDITPAAQNNINAKFIIVNKGNVTHERQNKMCLALVADETAAAHFQLWGDECDAFGPGDIILLSDGIFSYSGRGNLVLRAGKRGKALKVGEFTMTFVETPNMSEILWVPDPADSNKYVQQAVISLRSRIFPPNSTLV